LAERRRPLAAPTVGAMSDTPPTNGPLTPSSPVAGDGPVPLGERLGGYRRRRRAKKALRSGLRTWLTRSGLALLLVVLAVVGLLFGYSQKLSHELQKHQLKVRHLTKVATKGKAKGVFDILLVGSTSRCALKVQNAAFGLCSQGVTGVNSDVVMVVRLDPNNHKVTLLSFPRDTFIPNARPDEYNRIDSALVYGPGQLVQAVQQDFGVPINHYVVLNFDTFANVVDALGGVRVDFPDRMYDNYSQLDITKTGCVYLNGFQALALVRARHTYYWTAGQTMNVAAIKAGNGSASGGEYDGSGDIGRIERDHIFLKILASAVAARGLGDPFTDHSLLSAIVPQLETDTSFSLGEMLDLVLNFRGTNFGASPETTIPVVEDTQSFIYKGYNYGDLVFPSEPQDQEAIDSFLGSPLPGIEMAPGAVSVSVVGGIGSPAKTARTARQLKNLGYRVLAAGEQTPVGPISETSVIYSPGHLAEGERVQASLAGAVALGTGKTTDGADVTVITGTDFSVHGGTLPISPTKASEAAQIVTKTPVTAGPPSGAGSSRLTSATSMSLATLVSDVVLTSAGATGYADGGALAPPTSATVAIPSYDPRACPTATTKASGASRVKPASTAKHKKPS